MSAIPTKNGNGPGRIVQIVLACVGIIIVSVAGAFFAFGQQNQSSIVKLQASEDEDARQRQVDQATIKALNEALRIVTVQLGAIDTRIAVLEARVATLEAQLTGGK